jgi:hypothetical protein
MPEDQTRKADKPVKTDSPENEQMAARMSRLEKKITFLLGLVFLQTILISAWFLTYILPTVFIYVQAMLVIAALVAAAYYFRKQIPTWFGSATRSMFAFLDEAEKKV